jgi:hypothetical protein
MKVRLKARELNHRRNARHRTISLPVIESGVPIVKNYIRPMAICTGVRQLPLLSSIREFDLRSRFQSAGCYTVGV